MSDRELRSVRVDPDVWSEFREQIDEWDGENPGHVGYHVEQALQEYIDTDRYARIEDKVDSVLAHVSDGGGAHTHTTTQASETVERARQIYRRLADNHGLVVKDGDVIRAVEDIAGADDRTVQKYKEVLKRRSLLFEHPADSAVWTTDREKWVRWTENHVDNNPTLTVHDVIDEYDLDIDRYDELAAQIGVEL
jgi:hypothetical protein